MSPHWDKRRVLFVLPTLRGGGAERVVSTLLRHMDRERFLLTLVVVDASHAVLLSAIPPHVRVIDLGETRVRHALWSLFRTIWKEKPDTVFSTLGHLNLALAFLRPALPRATRFVGRETTLVSQLHASYKRPHIWNGAYRRFYKNFDQIVCQSKAMRDDLVQTCGIPEDKCIIINNPLDTERIRALAAEQEPPLGAVNARPAGLTHLVAAGRLSAEKGFDRLIRAMSLCSRTDLRLTILGDGPLRGELEALALSLGLTERVEFAGFQSNPYAFFRRADGFVLSSLYEGFPNVVLEALACNLPVIATPVASVKEILEDLEDCCMCTDFSAESLAEALQAFVPGVRIPDNAVQTYAVQTIIRQYEAVLG